MKLNNLYLTRTQRRKRSIFSTVCGQDASKISEPPEEAQYRQHESAIRTALSC